MEGPKEDRLRGEKNLPSSDCYDQGGNLVCEVTFEKVRGQGKKNVHADNQVLHSGEHGSRTTGLTPSLAEGGKHRTVKGTDGLWGKEKMSRRKQKPSLGGINLHNLAPSMENDPRRPLSLNLALTPGPTYSSLTRWNQLE